MSSWGNNSSKRNYKKGRGRQKVEMAKIQNASNLQVTFSKRRGGLFKKASELSTLCAAETAVVVFSPGGKPHSFGHPDVESVCSRFLSQPQNVLEANGGGGGGDGLLEAHKRANISRQILELNRLQQQVEVERERARELERRRWCGPGLGYAELARLEEAVLRFKDQFEEGARVCVDGGAGFGPATYLPGCGFRGGGPVECEMMGSESSILIPYSSPPPTPAHN